MPLTKDSALRIEIIDSCLRRKQKKWTFEELLHTLNAKLQEQIGKSVSRRTLQYDLDYLINEKQAPVEKTREGNKVIYSYSDANYSVKNLPVNEEEITYLKDAVEILKQVSDFPIIHDVDEIISKLENTISTNVPARECLIQFEKITSPTGSEYLDNIFTAIKEKSTLKIIYHPFGRNEPLTWLVHPYLLKEYRNRWFLIARINNDSRITNIALDRIKKIGNSKEEFIANDLFDPETYFNDMIGVTLPESIQPQDVIIKVSKGQVPYIKTKPIHFSQETLKEYEDGGIKIRLHLINNYELRSALLAYGSSIEIQQPASLREQLKQEFQTAVSKYQ